MSLRTSKNGNPYYACARSGADPKCKGFVRVKNAKKKANDEGTPAASGASDDISSGGAADIRRVGGHSGTGAGTGKGESAGDPAVEDSLSSSPLPDSSTSYSPEPRTQKRKCLPNACAQQICVRLALARERTDGARGITSSAS